MGEGAGDKPAVETRQKSEGRRAPPRWRVPAVPPLRVWPARFAALSTALHLTFERELEQGRGFLWLPVFFGLGIATYFALPREPSLIALVAATTAAVLSAWMRRHAVTSFRIAIIFFAVFAGLTAAKVRTDSALAPVLPGERTVSSPAGS